MKKEKELPSFDDLKNPNYVYYYSRSERIARRRKKELFEFPERKRGILGYLSGGNPQVSNFLVFYIFLAIIFWIFAYLRNPARKSIEKKSFHYPEKRKVEISFIENENIKGINVIFVNEGERIWKIERLILSNNNGVFETNLQMEVKSKEFEALFIENKNIISDKKNIFVNVE